MAEVTCQARLRAWSGRRLVRRVFPSPPLSFAPPDRLSPEALNLASSPPHLLQ